MTDQAPSLKQHWASSSLGQRFEIAITIALYVVLAVVAGFALFRLAAALITMMLGPLDITDSWPAFSLSSAWS